MSLKEKFNELAKLGEDWVKRGLINDSLVIHGGKGYADTDPTQVYQFTSDNFAVGDVVAMGNVMGIIDEVYVEDGFAVALLVTHTAYTPLEYKSDPTNYGNNSDGHTKTSILKLTDMPMDDFLTLLSGDEDTFDIVNMSSPDLGMQSVLVFKTKTDDPKTWSQIQQDVLAAGFTELPELIEIVLDPKLLVFNIHNQSGNVSVEDWAKVGFREFPKMDDYAFSIAGNDITVLIDSSTGNLTIPDDADEGDYIITVTTNEDGLTDTAVLTIINDAEQDAGLIVGEGVVPSYELQADPDELAQDNTSQLTLLRNGEPMAPGLWTASSNLAQILASINQGTKVATNNTHDGDWEIEAWVHGQKVATVTITCTSRYELQADPDTIAQGNTSQLTLLDNGVPMAPEEWDAISQIVGGTRSFDDVTKVATNNSYVGEWVIQALVDMYEVATVTITCTE